MFSVSTRFEHARRHVCCLQRCIEHIFRREDNAATIPALQPVMDAVDEELRKNKVKYVSVTAASNVTGYVTDVHMEALRSFGRGSTQLYRVLGYEYTGHDPRQFRHI